MDATYYRNNASCKGRRCIQKIESGPFRPEFTEFWLDDVRRLATAAAHYAIRMQKFYPKAAKIAATT